MRRRHCAVLVAAAMVGLVLAACPAPPTRTAEEAVTVPTPASMPALAVATEPIEPPPVTPMPPEPPSAKATVTAPPVPTRRDQILITGAVIDGATGRPVPIATVLITPKVQRLPTRWTTADIFNMVQTGGETDAAGTYQLWLDRGMAGLTVSVAVAASGYHNLALPGALVIPRDPVDRLTLADIRLEPASR